MNALAAIRAELERGLELVNRLERAFGVLEPGPRAKRLAVKRAPRIAKKEGGGMPSEAQAAPAATPAASKAAVTGGEYTCEDCGEVKARDAFATSSRGGRYGRCRECHGAAIKKAKSARQGEPTAQGKTGGAPPPNATTAAGSTAPTRRRIAAEAEQARTSAQPVTDEQGGPPAPRRVARQDEPTREQRVAEVRRRTKLKPGRLGSATLICKTCGAEVPGAKASQHAYEVHGQRVVRELLAKAFDGVPSPKPDLW